MDFIQSSNKQVDKFGVGKHGFSAGNPTGGVLATFFTNTWADGVQQEIINAIEAAGLVPSSGDLSQLRKAIQFFSTGRLLTAQRFLNSDTIVAPFAGAKLFRVRVRGGGGASGGTPATAGGMVAVSGPGAGGGYVEALLNVSDLVFPITLVVGAGGVGASGANGGAGGTSSFGAYAQATGGQGGLTAATTAGPLLLPGSPTPGLGTASTGVVTACAGAPGGFSQILSTVSFSAGDGGACGDGAPGGVRGAGVANFGAGAGGRAVGVISAATAGLNGGQGVITLEQYS